MRKVVKEVKTNWKGFLENSYFPSGTIGKRYRNGHSGIMKTVRTTNNNAFESFLAGIVFFEGMWTAEKSSKFLIKPIIVEKIQYL